MSDNIWTALAAPLPKDKIEWRIDGKVVNGQARFVAYIDSHFVRERLDSAAVGEWSSKLTREPEAADRNGEAIYVYHCTLSVLGTSRDDVGEGDSPKTAATDAFKRAAVRFGIGAELYSYGPNYVKVNDKGVPLEDPQAAYERRKDSGQVAHPAAKAAAPQGFTEADKQVIRESAGTAPARSAEEPPCPKCGGRVWDNRVGKKNPKAPDYKCRDKSCDGVIWPPKGSVAAAKPAIVQADDEPYAAALSRAVDEEADLPF